MSITLHESLYRNHINLIVSYIILIWGMGPGKLENPMSLPITSYGLHFDLLEDNINMETKK